MPDVYVCAGRLAMAVADAQARLPGRVMEIDVEVYEDEFQYLGKQVRQGERSGSVPASLTGMAGRDACFTVGYSARFTLRRKLYPRSPASSPLGYNAGLSA